jgi:hypothetical protein
MSLAENGQRTVTRAEIGFGIERGADPERRADLSAWFGAYLAATVRGPGRADHRACHAALAPGRGGRSPAGHTYSEPDVFIAAVAVVEQLIVLSRAGRDLIEARAPVRNPWAGHSPPLARREKLPERLDRATSSMGSAEIDGMAERPSAALR